MTYLRGGRTKCGFIIVAAKNIIPWSPWCRLFRTSSLFHDAVSFTWQINMWQETWQIRPKKSFEKTTNLVKLLLKRVKNVFYTLLMISKIIAMTVGYFYNFPSFVWNINYQKKNSFPLIQQIFSAHISTPPWEIWSISKNCF